jgi:hypothetical protein
MTTVEGMLEFFFYLEYETIGTAATPGLLCQPRVIMSQSQSQSQSQSHVTTDGQSVSPSWCRAPSGAHDQIFLLLESYSPVLMGRSL